MAVPIFQTLNRVTPCHIQRLKKPRVAAKRLVVWHLLQQPTPLVRNARGRRLRVQEKRPSPARSSAIAPRKTSRRHSLFWTLFGPYAGGRCGPRGNGAGREIRSLGRHATPADVENQLEVLAGAIPWGFKSPSTHQSSFGSRVLQAFFFRMTHVRLRL